MAAHAPHAVRPGGSLLAVLAGAMLAMTYANPSASAADRMLFDFEEPGQLQAWDPDPERAPDRHLSLAAPEVTAGDQALRIVFAGTDSDWPGIATGKIPSDWSSYEALKLDVYSKNPIAFKVRIDDHRSVDHKSRFGYEVVLAERKTLVQIPLSSIARTLDVKNIRLLCFFTDRMPAGTTIHIDNVRLGDLEAVEVPFVPFEQRKDAPYTDAVRTPVAWQARPLPGGPVKLFAIPSVQYGRELVELAQRLDIEYGLVTWDRSWGQNTWGLGDHYGQRGHRFDFKDVQNYLSMELAGPNEYDVYLIRTPVGWKWFPKAAREGLLERVKAGAGLVLVQPYSGDPQFDASDLWSISPLTDCATDTMQEPGGDMREPAEGLVRGQPWQVAAPDHYIVKDLPLDLLPFQAMAYQQYKVAPDAQVLVKSASGDPIVAVRPFGKGRVVTLAYRPFDMTPQVDHPAGGKPPVDYAYWEVGYALVGRAVLWAAGREADLAVPEEFVRQAKAQKANPLVIETADTVKAGEPIAVKVSLAGRADGWTLGGVRLEDTYGRTIERAALEDGAATLPSERVSTWAAIVSAEATSPTGETVEKTFPVVLTPEKAVWRDYEVIMWPNDRLPWQRSLIYEQMRQWGCTATLDPAWRNDALMRERLVNGMRIVPHGVRRQLLQIDPDVFAVQKQQYELTKDKKYLERFMCISDPEVRASEREILVPIVERLAKLRPLAYCIGEEDSITSYRAELDLCFAPATLHKFREYLKEKYDGDLAALNAHWGTQFAGWDDVMPMTAEEAKAHGNFAPWAVHRTFMDDEWADIYFFYLDILKEIDHPDVLMGTSGTQVPTPHDGQDWYKLMPAFNWLSSYTYGHQDEMHMNFAAGKPYITAATGYGISAERAQHQLWGRLFHGNSGAIIFWWIAVQNPDLSLCKAGQDLGRVIGELAQGAGRLVFEADRLHDPIAVHYSIPSMQAGYITTGGMSAYESALDAWWVALQDLGYQPVFVSSQQIEQGRLTKEGFKAIVMPRSVALSRKEKEQIEAFAAGGGAVLGSKIDVGIYDADLAKHDAPQSPRVYVALDAQQQRDELARALGSAGLRPPVTVESLEGSTLKGLEVVRYRLDDVELIGFLRPPAGVKQVVGPDGVIRFEPDPEAGKPVERVRVTFAGQGRLFDVRKRRPIDPQKVRAQDGSLSAEIDLPAGDATLLAVVPAEAEVGVRPAHATVEQGGDVQIAVTSSVPARRVVRVEVRRPDGTNAAWLTRNLVLKGQDQIAAAVALTDEPGEWTVTATDVITGKSDTARFHVTAPAVSAQR